MAYVKSIGRKEEAVDVVNLGCGCQPIYHEPLEWEIPFKLNTSTSEETDEFDFDSCYLKNKIINEYKNILDQLECGTQPNLDILMEELSLLTINSFYRKPPEIEITDIQFDGTFALIGIKIDRKVQQAKIINLTKSTVLKETDRKTFSWFGAVDSNDEILIKVKANNGLSAFKIIKIDGQEDNISYKDDEITFVINEANYGQFKSPNPNLGLTLGGFEVALTKEQVVNSGVVYYIYTTVEQIRPGEWTFKIIEK